MKIIEYVACVVLGSWLGIFIMCLLSIKKESDKNSGVWIKTVHGYKCSNCDCLATLGIDNFRPPHCPWCGASMEDI